MKPDKHTDATGQYMIRSLYFDDLADTCLNEKLDGIMNRDKYRIRYYNKDPDSLINLEKKSKRGDICIKSSELLSKDEVQRI